MVLCSVCFLFLLLVGFVRGKGHRPDREAVQTEYGQGRATIRILGIEMRGGTVLLVTTGRICLGAWTTFSCTRMVSSEKHMALN